jgi:hypothetical protein
MYSISKFYYNPIVKMRVVSLLCILLNNIFSSSEINDDL